MKLGLSPSNYDLLISEVVTPLKKSGATVYCFGSRARGDYREFSDLDIMVEGGKGNDDLIATITERFQNSNFPIKLDLVKFENFAESYREGYLKERVKL